jgi:hypothetical protein
MLCAIVVAASAADASGASGKYPDWKGQWTRARVPGAMGQPPHDPSKPPGRGQQAPPTLEYQARFEANLVDQAAGGQGSSDTFVCLPNGMPRMMSAYEPIEFVVTPDILHGPRYAAGRNASCASACAYSGMWWKLKIPHSSSGGGSACTSISGVG